MFVAIFFFFFTNCEWINGCSVFIACVQQTPPPLFWGEGASVHRLRLVKRIKMIGKALGTRLDSFAYNESHRDSYPQFPQCPLETPGSIPSFSDGPTEKKTLTFLEFRSAKASSTKKWNGYKAAYKHLYYTVMFFLLEFFLTQPTMWNVQ